MSQIHLIAPSGYCINGTRRSGAFSVCWNRATVENQTIIPAASSVLPVPKRSG